MRSFKSVGITSAELTEQQTAVAPTPRPIGIITPLRLGEGDEGLLGMHYSVGETMKNNLRDLIMTNHGERLALYDYGANLGPLVTEYELGKYACFSDYNQESLAIAKSQIPLAKQKIFEAIDNFKPQLQNFIIETQKNVKNYPFPNNFNKKYLLQGKLSKLLKYKIASFVNKNRLP